MFRRLITLIGVAAISGTAGVVVGIFLAPAAGEETRAKVSTFWEENGGPVMDGLEKSSQMLGDALDYVTSRVSADEDDI